MRLIASVSLLLGLLAASAGALDKHDYAAPGWGTTAGFEADGDTFATYTVTCSSTALTTIRSAVVDRSRRRLHIQNRSAYLINLGTSTVIASDIWTLGESTNSATSPLYDTYNSGTLGCIINNAPVAGTAVTATLQVIEEDASQDVSGKP